MSTSPPCYPTLQIFVAKVNFNEFLPFLAIRVLMDTTVLQGGGDWGTEGRGLSSAQSQGYFSQVGRVCLIPQARWKSQSWRLSSKISIWEARAQETLLPARVGDQVKGAGIGFSVWSPREESPLKMHLFGISVFRL